MNQFNAIAAVLDALKTFPEPVQIPDALVDVEPLALAEARSRLQQIAQVATELRRLIDQELATKIPTALRYGEDVYRPNVRGAHKVNEHGAWWAFVVEALSKVPNPAGLLGGLYPMNSVRLGALNNLAEVMGLPPKTVRDTFIHYDPPTSPLSVMPMSKAPKYLQDLEEGEIR